MEIEEFDYKMKTAIQRQVELGAPGDVSSICDRLLNDMANGNFSNITRSCRSFFQSINIPQILQELMGCDFLSAKYLYSRRIQSLIQNNTQNYQPSQVTQNGENLDDISIKVDQILSLSINHAQKLSLFQSLYYGNDNHFLGYLPEAISQEEIKIMLIKNCLNVSILSTNTSGEQRKEENIIYEGLTLGEMQDILIGARNIISKLLGFDSKQRSDDGVINSKKLAKNINSLNDDDISFLSELYMMTRRDSNTRRIMRTAFSNMYTIDDINRNQYMNTHYLDGIVKSEEFLSDLKNSYHI